MYRDEVKKHLEEKMIPFWKRLKDDKYGGFYGLLDDGLNLHDEAEKGGILNSRILWFFSNANLTLKDGDCLEYATHAYKFLKEYFLDHENGGVYWSVTFDGKPGDDSKHTYCQAFAIYALASYYAASGITEALDIAYSLVDCVEHRCKDEIGYLEAFDRQFQAVSNEKLSENGVMAARTMNTILHVLEAYSELYRVDNNQKVGEAIRWILDVFADKIYNQEKRRLEVFFDLSMNSLTDLISYGHDIEASWLIDRGCELLGDPVYTGKMKQITEDLADHIHAVAFDGNSVNNECFQGNVDIRKVWWVQAEAVVGFVNAYQKNPGRYAYLEAAGAIWEYIKAYIIDSRPGSEWLNELHADGTPITGKEIAGPWKCPYHNGRMCFEIIRRKVEF